jgi:[acyl-carrier-protein] S-malonyltransferase
MRRFSKVAFLFPGQGAQYPGMAKDFVESFSIARHTFEEADDLLGRKLSSVILGGPDKVLTETWNSQTGIYVVSLAILRVIQQLFPDLTAGVCSGLSLGEYTAITASGRLTFAEGLLLVQYRGQFMNEACEATKGTMAVILGLDADQVAEIVKEVNLPNDLWVANFNCPGQVVISGTLKGIDIGSDAARAKGAKRILPLQVHGAFHSGLMRLAGEKLAEYILEAPIKESEITLVMNVTGNAVKEIPTIKQNLIKQVTSPVRWEQSIRWMSQVGVDFFVEMGCGKTLAGFNKRIGILAPCISIEKLEDIETMESLFNSFIGEK